MNNYSNSEKADMLRCYYISHNNARRASARYQQMYPYRMQPSFTYFNKLEHKLRESGSFNDKENRQRRQNEDQENAEINILALLEANPRTSIREIAEECGCSVGFVSKIIKKHKFKAYKVQPVHEVMAGDYPRRMDFCRWLSREIHENRQYTHDILWSDESNFSNCGKYNRQNTHVWSQQQPNAIQPTNFQRRFSINVWAGVLGTRIIGPHFYEGTLTADRYLNFLQAELPNYLEEVPMAFRNRIIYMHDGAPPHNRRDVTLFLNQRFRKWIGNKAPVELGNILWPARSPDLSPLDFAIWGFIKSKVYATRTRDLEHLKNKIREAFRSITPEMLRNIQNQIPARLDLCLRENGRNFEQFLK